MQKLGDCDIAIVGGGPAGAYAAWLLTRAGARVRLFDPSHPREKPCGGGVTGRALALVAPMLGLEPIAGVPISTARFEVDSGRTASGSAPRTATVALDANGFTPDSSLIVMSRLAFDRALLEGAIAAGAVHDASRVTHVEASARGATVATAAGSWSARLVIGADGANSFVRRRLGRAFARRQLSIATGFFAHGVTSREIVTHFVPEPQGYIWSFPRADHLAIGICAQADESQPGPLREIVERWIHASGIAPGASLEAYSWPIPSLAAEDLDRDEPGGPGWLLIGDAAGLVDPITREGIFFALRSAQLAVDAITAADGASVPHGAGADSDPYVRYRAALQADIYPELSRAAQMKRDFFRGPFTRLLVDALDRSEPVRAIMRDLVAGEQPYRTLRRRLISTFELGLAWQLARLQFGW